MNRRVGLGLLGCGAVGGAFVRLLVEQRATYRDRHGIDLDLCGVAVKRLKATRATAFDLSLLTDDVDRVVEHSEVDTVIELIGDLDAASAAIRRALNAGKNVVTANKTLLAEQGRELLDLAHQNGAQLRFEGAVGGAVPVVGALMSSLSANQVTSITAILNGTTNYMLSRMTLDGLSYEQALRQASERGFTERDPQLDVSGRDSAQKLAILAALGFGLEIRPEAIPTEGITDITPEDITAAARFGYTVRLLAVAQRSEAGVELRVNPALIPNGTFLATIQDEFNAFLIRGHASGDVVLIGRGPGPQAAAGAVLADVAEIAIRNLGRRSSPSLSWQWSQCDVVPDRTVSTGYYMRFPVNDSPGKIGTLTQILGAHSINIDSASARHHPQRIDWGLVEVLCRSAGREAIQTATRAIEETGILVAPCRALRIEEWRPEHGYFSAAGQEK